MEIPIYLYRKLKDSKKFSLPDLSYSNSPYLPPELIETLIQGTGFKTLLQVLYGPDTFTLTNLKEENTPAARLSNWTLISNALLQKGVIIPSDAKSLIIAGDKESLLNLLFQLSNTDHSEKVTEGVNIETLNIYKPLEYSESCLEFLILSLVQKLNLSPKQSAAILLQNGHYFQQIMVHGFKNDYTNILEWLQAIYQEADKLSELIEEENSLNFIFGLLKSGFMTNSPEVAQWTVRLIGKISLEFTEQSFIDETWNWLINKEESVLVYLVEAANKFEEEFYEFTVEILTIFGQEKYLELFSFHLRKVCENLKDYILFVSHLLPYFLRSSITCKALFKSGVVSYWIELCLRQIKAEPEENTSNFMFLVELIEAFKKKIDLIDSVEDVIKSLNQVYKKNSIVKSEFATGLLFYLLEIFTDQKSEFAILTYKTLIFAFIEQFEASELREFFTANLKLILHNENIPLAIFIEPYIKRLQAPNFKVEIFDIDLVEYLSSHEGLSIENGVCLIDYTAKVFLNELVYSKIIEKSFQVLTKRFLYFDSMKEYLFMFCRYALNLTTNTENFQAQFRNSDIDLSIKERKIIKELNQQKKNVVRLVKWIIELEEDELNKKVLKLAVEINESFIEVTNENSQTLISILELYGDVDEILNKHTRLYTTFEEEEKDFTEREIKAPKKQKLSFPYKKAEAGIEKYKEQFLDKIKRKEKEMAKKQKVILNEQKKAQEELAIRRVSQTKSKSEIASLLLPGEAEKFLDENYNELLELSPAEEKDQELLDIILKKYNRVFKVIFHEFSGSGYHSKLKKISDFDFIKSTKQSLTEAEFTKFLQEYTIIPKFLSKEELKNLMRSYSIKNTIEPGFLNFFDFKQIFSEISWQFYKNNNEFDFSFTPVMPVIFMIQHMKSVAKSKGESTEIYDTPINYKEKSINELNQNLIKNPSATIPEGFIKIKEVDLIIAHELPSFFKIPKAIQISFEILNEILNDCLQIKIIHPEVIKNIKLRVKENKQKKTEEKLKPVYERLTEKPQPIRNKSVLEKESEEEFYSPIKPESRVLSRLTQSEEKFTARKAREEQMLKKKIKEDEEKRKARQKKLLYQLEESKEERKKKLIQGLEMRKQEKSLERLKKEKEIERENKAEIRKAEKLREWTNKREEDSREEKRIFLSYEKKKRIETRKEKEFFKERNNEKLDELIRNRNEVSRLERLEEEKKIQREVEEKKKMRKKNEKILNMGRSNSESEFDEQEKVNKVYEESQEILCEFESQLLEIFKHFSESFDSKLSSFNLESYEKFCWQFSIVPKYLSSRQNEKIFEKISNSPTISFESFKLLLVWLSLKLSSSIKPEIFSKESVAMFLKTLSLKNPLEDIQRKLQTLSSRRSTSNLSRISYF